MTNSPIFKQALLQDTPLKSHPISRHGAVTKPIETQRDMLLDSTKQKIVSGSIEAFVARYMPFMNTKDALVDAVTDNLKKGTDRCLSAEDGWIPIKKHPNMNEDETFAEMAKIADAVYEQAVKYDPTLKEKRTTILECRSRHTVAGEVPGASFLPDAIVTVTKPAATPNTQKPKDAPRRSPRLQAKNQAIFYGDVSKETRNASDAGVLAEFKLSRTPDSIADNERKIVGGSGYLLFNDPCRRFAFGFTIEDDTLRLWYFSRGHMAVSEGIDFHQSPYHFVRFLLFLTFAPQEGLGYDSTVQRVDNMNDQGQKEIAYRYKVGNDWYETVGKPLYEDQCVDIVTHAPRVWKVKKVVKAVDGTEGLAADFNVLKDYYLYDDANTERQIQDDVFARLRRLDAKNGGSTTHELDARPYFMTILADERVPLEDGSPDKTPKLLDDFGPFEYTLKTDKHAAPAKVPGSHRTNGHDEHRAQPSRRPHLGPKLQLQSRVHQRIVFKELCSSPYILRDLQKYTDCLTSIVKGLYFLRLAGYVHRDISPGNCLCFEGRVVITDLEFAKPYTRVSLHDPRAGTAEFMAVEAQERLYLFETMDMPYDTEWFKFNHMHDLESVLWMFIWFLMQRIPVPLLPRLSQQLPGYMGLYPEEPLITRLEELFRVLFECGCDGSRERTRLIVQNTKHPLWSLLGSLYVVDSPFDINLRDVVLDLIRSFRVWYTAIENSAPLDVDGSRLWSDDVFKAEYYDKVLKVFSEVSMKMGSVEVRSLKEYNDELEHGSATGNANPTDVEDVQEYQSGDKRKRNGGDDGTVEKEVEPTTKGSKRSKSGKSIQSGKNTESGRKGRSSKKASKGR